MLHRKPPSQRRCLLLAVRHSLHGRAPSLDAWTKAHKATSFHSCFSKAPATSAIKTTTAIPSIVICFGLTIYSSYREVDRRGIETSAFKFRGLVPAHPKLKNAASRQQAWAVPWTRPLLSWLRPPPLLNLSLRRLQPLHRSNQLSIFPTPFLPPDAADASVRLPPLAAHTQQSYYYPSSTAFSHQWPAAPAADIRAGQYQPATQNHIPPFSFPSSSSYTLIQAPEANPCVRLPPQTVTAPSSLPSIPALQTKPQFTLFTVVPLSIPPNAAALEPPPVPNTVKAQILAGADVDLSSLLSLLPPAETHRQIDCGDFSVTLKNPAPSSSRTLSFSEFIIAFGRYTEIICSAFPHRWRELNDYLAIIAELALSYGRAHFYTYHKLFSAKCAVRVAQWNQCPYWGALDSDLHNRIFFSCRNKNGKNLITLKEYSLHYHDIDQAISMIKNVGRCAWLAKVDITAAFKVRLMAFCRDPLAREILFLSTPNLRVQK
ncbi:Filamentous hemagglutinin [Labeo rohita]|uniref:Filamentous hemagglutinin n=1 Tax=Labeo rohita TaxID=84645 RepID=A0ABQ8L644_LABRO|nr:Filamentous hemagglutinin [Labeo rohita]